MLTLFASTVSASALTSFLDNSNGSVTHICYLGTNKNVYEMYWSGGWQQRRSYVLAGTCRVGLLIINNSAIQYCHILASRRRSLHGFHRITRSVVV
jgi:hypothetical protein